MQTASGTFANWVSSNGFVVEHKVTVDLPAGDFSDMSLVVESIEIDRQTTTDMPDGSRLITGYPIAEATVVLSGAITAGGGTITVAELYNPYATDSPLYLKDAIEAAIAIETGIYLGTSGTPELITGFTGVIDDYTIDPDGTVTLTCLDNGNKLTIAPNVPAFPANYLRGLIPIQPGLTAVWPLDYVLRAAGVYSGPAPRTGCAFYMSGHGSLWPEIMGVPSLVQVANHALSGPPSWVPGAWGAGQTAADAQLNAGMSNAIGFDNGNSVYVEFSVESSAGASTLKATVEAAGGAGDDAFSVSAVQDASGLLTVSAVIIRNSTEFDISTTAASRTFPGKTGWHEIGALLTFTGATTASYSVWVDGTLTTASLTGVPAGTKQVLDSVVINSQLPIDTVQITTESAPGGPAAFTPTAILDASLNTGLVTCPDVGGKDAWGSVVQPIAEAELAVAGFDETGVFRFTNRDTLRSASSVRSITSTASLKALGVQVSGASVANHVQMPFNSLNIGAPAVIWSASDVISIAAYSTYSTIITTDTPVVGVPSADSGYAPVTGLQVAGDIYWRAAHAADGTTGAVTSGVAIAVTQLSPTSLALAITNGNAFTVYMVNPAGAADGDTGDAYVLLGGLPVIATGMTADAEYPAPADGGSKSTRYGEKLFQVAQNDWVQDLDFAQLITSAILHDQRRPKPLWRDMDIVADPRLQLADRVTISDPDGSLIEDDGRIFSINFKSSATEWDQTIDARAVSRPGAWVLGKAGRSELGDTTTL